MLGATRTGTLVHSVSVPPRDSELSATGKRDWKTGVELVKTCMDTHDTATYALPEVYHFSLLLMLCSRRGLSPEIVHFRIPSDRLSRKMMTPSDWYIKGARWVVVLLSSLCQSDFEIGLESSLLTMHDICCGE
jgi:endoplasmic reticulum Man9GlcNAc2 1,2-alpha-mannosidase